MEHSNNMIVGLARKLRNYLPIGRLSFSQEGEDLVLARILGEKQISSGFFVDVGAHHPTRFSNTYYFYRRGWSGINIDALPGTEKLFKRMRPRDINIECGVAQVPGEMTYYQFNDPALNTFSKSEAERKNQSPYHLIGTQTIAVRTLADILQENVPSGTVIDFMSVDAEGLDYEILLSNNWERFRPQVLVVELLNTELTDYYQNPTAVFLKRLNYRLFAKTLNSYFFVCNDAF